MTKAISLVKIINISSIERCQMAISSMTISSGIIQKAPLHWQRKPMSDHKHERNNHYLPISVGSSHEYSRPSPCYPYLIQRAGHVPVQYTHKLNRNNKQISRRDHGLQVAWTPKHSNLFVAPKLPARNTHHSPAHTQYEGFQFRSSATPRAPMSNDAFVTSATTRTRCSCTT